MQSVMRKRERSLSNRPRRSQHSSQTQNTSKPRLQTARTKRRKWSRRRHKETYIL